MELIPARKQALERLHKILMEDVTAGQRPAYPALQRPQQSILADEAPVRSYPMPMSVATARVELSGTARSMLP